MKPFFEIFDPQDFPGGFWGPIGKSKIDLTSLPDNIELSPIVLYARFLIPRDKVYSVYFFLRKKKPVIFEVVIITETFKWSSQFWGGSGVELSDANQKKAEYFLDQNLKQL